MAMPIFRNPFDLTRLKARYYKNILSLYIQYILGNFNQSHIIIKRGIFFKVII